MTLIVGAISYPRAAYRPSNIRASSDLVRSCNVRNRVPWVKRDDAVPPTKRRTTRKRQTACKPGSVPAAAGDGHSSGTSVAERLVRPTRAAARKPACLRPKPQAAAPIWSCSRWGLPCRSRYRDRGALLPHPFTLTRGPWGARAVCFLWHFPWGRPRRGLPGTVFPWSPDFPPRADFSSAAGRPSGRLAFHS